MEQNQENDQVNVFNMAASTLAKIHEILKHISNASTMHDITGENGFPPGYAQHLKYRLVKQLFIQSSPLIEKNNEWKTKTFNKIKEIRLKYRNVVRDGELKNICEEYSPNVDEVLDDLVLEIQNKLAEQGFFKALRTYD